MANIQKELKHISLVLSLKIRFYHLKFLVQRVAQFTWLSTHLHSDGSRNVRDFIRVFINTANKKSCVLNLEVSNTNSSVLKYRAGLGWLLRCLECVWPQRASKLYMSILYTHLNYGTRSQVANFRYS